jgi:outer membrane protein OmpA-like peptidoglycan-associated protein
VRVEIRGGQILEKEVGLLRKKMVFTFRNILFDFNKATLRPESYPVLDSIAQVLKENPTVVVEIGGHTDTRGSFRYNLRLSQARANSVREYLLQKGIEPNRLIAKGYGEMRPLVKPERTEADYQKNRRVEFRILGEVK